MPKMHRRILLVDDSATIRQLLKFGLSRVSNATCDEAADGQQALKMVDKQRYDLILADINMPVMDGLKMLEELRSRPEHRGIPVVIITTEGAAADQQKAMEKGANAYLTKPVQIPMFLQVVEGFLK
jgi:two-component system, chemotaxis family, chemotaxis protein CheY